MPKSNENAEKEQRATQYERGYAVAIQKYSLLISLCVDTFPAGPSPAVMGRIGPNGIGAANTLLVDDILGELKRFSKTDARRSKSAPAEAAA